MSIDVHAHVFVPHYHQLLAGMGIVIPGYTADGGASAPGDDAVTDGEEALRRRIALMDDAGVERQLLSAVFAPYVRNGADAVAAARCVNDAHAAAVRRHPGRLAAYAALPLPHLDASIAELERCLDELGMIGVALHCACLGESVVAERFDPLYEELNRRRAVLFFHPCVNGLCSGLLTDWGLAPTAGAVFEDTTVALHLILRRIPQRFPDITIIIPHLGGALPMMLNRLDNQLPLSCPDLPERPSRTARRFFYDTVGHGSAAALRCAVEAFGADRILLGSDYPVLLAFESYRDTANYPRTHDVAATALSEIIDRNAAQIFG
ncbi:amidohydrolase family protein [Mycolicibacter kumamotonensis]|uniref:Amidohydrolase n=1 Tax=Mycolicibacter kumamotonensis TaxID=354243 RepID=A0A7K3L6B3_9MYCO|nr:amidohydrolase [Mycolicibacter kumamotonensis]